MAGQDPRYVQKRRRNRNWLPFLVILFGIYMINNLMPLIIVGLVIAAVLILASLVLPVILNAWGGTIEVQYMDRMQGGLSWLNGLVHDLLVPKYGPPFSSTQDERTTSMPIAEDAMSRAGWSFDHTVWLSDVGLLVYLGPKPTLHRTSTIPTSVKYVRPFIVMEVPWNITNAALADYGSVRFNLIDWQGNLRFTARKRYVLKPGQNFLTPDTWLPIANQQEDLNGIQDNRFGGEWDLQVLSGQSVIADHRFGWRQVAEPDIVPLTADGEVNEQAREWLEDTPEDPVSLEDLMAEQAQDQRETRRASRAGAR